MKEDFNRLRLKYHGNPSMMDEILQRECRYKTSAKLPETLKCEGFRFPSLAVAEMATSDAVAKLHSDMIDDGTRVLDMTCGLGIDSFHFATKAKSVTAVELDHHAYTVALENARALRLENVKIVEGDSLDYLAKCDEMFDVIFVDPARRDSSGRHFALRDCSPDIIPALSLILSRCSTLIVKASPMIDIRSAVNELGRNCEVTVIGTKKECKEVVFKIASGSEPTSNPKLTKLETLTTEGTNLSFTPGMETDAAVSYSTPKDGAYLYEPYPAVMKAGGMKLLSATYHIGKLHPNTHLFTSEQKLDSFPGEVFEIIKVLPFSKQTVKMISKEYPVINVATRNFPLSAPQLATKLKIKEGGDKMIFGTTAPDGSRLLIVTTMGTAL